LTEAFAGQLGAGAGAVTEIRNTDEKAPDMRRKLCSDDAVAYEAERDLLFPMGLPGQPTYLGPAGPIETRVIKTWTGSLPPDVPVPTPRPAP
jgi:D-alanyl-D-alanine carboxypeptidase